MQTPKLKSWLYILAIFSVFLLVPMVTYAGLGGVVTELLYYILIYPFKILLQLELIALTKIAQWSHFTNMSGVNEGWIALRDLSNMFFIVILLVMAFATILKIDAYGYKQVLKRLILMAILINFSKLIVGLVIDGSQLVMLTFVATWKDIAAGNMVTALGLDSIMTMDADKTATGNVDIFSNIILGYLFAGVFIILTCVVVFGFIATLLVRIVTLWVLVVLSPLAFLANAFPGTQKYFSEWMGAFSKEVVVGPFLAFFLWLSFTIVGGGAGGDSSADVIKNLPKSQQGDVEVKAGGFTEATDTDHFLKFIVGIAMLLTALRETQKIGGEASGIGMKIAGKAKAGAIGAAAWGASKVWRGSSDYGGLRGGMQRATAWAGAGTLQTAGEITGISGFTRAGLKLRQGERDRKIAKRESLLKDTKGMTADEQREYLGDASIYARGARAKVDIEDGKLGENGNNDKAMLKLFKDLNDSETVKKIQAGSAFVHDSESIKGMMSGKGLTAASGINTDSLDSEGGQQVADHIFENYDADQVKKWTENMTKKEQDAWRAAMSGAAQRATMDSGGKKFDFSSMFKKDDDGKSTGQLDKDSKAYKAAMLDDKVYKQAYDGLANDKASQKQLAKAKGDSTRVEDLPKKKISDMGDEAYRAMVGNLSTQKASTFISSLSSGDERIEMVAAEQVANRDAGFLDSAALSGALGFKEKEKITKAGFDKKVKVEVQTSGKTEEVVRVELAKDNLRQAHNFFSDQKAFTAFVNTLTPRDAAKIDREKLEDILGDLSSQLREELANKHGIGKSKSKVDDYRERAKNIS